MTTPGDGLYEKLSAFREDIFRVCLGFSRNVADAEDLCQDVFLKALVRRDALRDLGGARIWLLRIARTTCLDRIRREKRRPTVSLDAVPGAAASVTAGLSPSDPGPALLRIKQAVGRLPRKQREVFVLREYAGLSYEEIVRTLGLKMGTVMSRLNRARRAVAAEAGEESHEHE